MERIFIKEKATLLEAFNTIDEQLVKFSINSVTKDSVDELKYSFDLLSERLAKLEKSLDKLNKFMTTQKELNTDIYVQLNK